VTDLLVATIAWIALGLHVVVGVATFRSGAWRPWLPLLNLTMAGGVVAYWVYRWYGYVVQGITWYASDQLVPVYAVLVCVLAVISLTSRHHLVTLNWMAFVIHGVVALGAVLFVTFFRMGRLF
jgi:hypothetical protein